VLHEGIKVTLVLLELEASDLEDIGTAIVEETLVVRHHYASNVGKRVDVVLYPGNVDNIKMVSRLIEKKDIGTLKHCTGHSELHAPATRKGRHGVKRLSLSGISETYGSHGLEDFVAIKTSETLVL
jgi:hypothetical protein